MSWRSGRRPNRKLWRVARLAVLDAANWTCRTCGKHGRMEVDHITPIDLMPNDASIYDPKWLQCLCVACHRAKSKAERTIPNPGRDAWRELVAARMAES